MRNISLKILAAAMTAMVKSDNIELALKTFIRSEPVEGRVRCPAVKKEKRWSTLWPGGLAYPCCSSTRKLDCTT